MHPTKRRSSHRLAHHCQPPASREGNSAAGESPVSSRHPVKPPHRRSAACRQDFTGDEPGTGDLTHHLTAPTTASRQGPDPAHVRPKRAAVRAITGPSSAPRASCRTADTLSVPTRATAPTPTRVTDRTPKWRAHVHLQSPARPRRVLNLCRPPAFAGSPAVDKPPKHTPTHTSAYPDEHFRPLSRHHGPVRGLCDSLSEGRHRRGRPRGGGGPPRGHRGTGRCRARPDRGGRPPRAARVGRWSPYRL